MQRKTHRYEREREREREWWSETVAFISHNTFIIPCLIITAILTIVNLPYMHVGLFLFWLGNYWQRFNPPTTPISPAADTVAAGRCRGLRPEAVESLPVVTFSASPSSFDRTAVAMICAVCLREFEEGNVLRFLPGCHHRFHVPCIDTWLHLHSTCPVFRSLVYEPAPAPAKLREPTGRSGDYVTVTVD